MLRQPAIGQRLRIVREGRQLSLSDFSAKNSIPQDKIAAFESGAIVPSARELATIANALRVSVFDLVAGEDSGPIRARFRSAAPGASVAEQQSVDSLLALTKVIADLRRLRGVPPPATFALSPPPGQVANQGRWAADAARVRLQAGSEPIATLAAVLRKAGYVVAEHQFPDEISGVLLVRGEYIFIVVNAAEPPTRRTFSLAHEYGHALLDPDEKIVVSRIGDTQDRERRAERFASHLLMPRPTLGKRFADVLADGKPLNFVHLVRLAVEFRVSYEALLIALREAGLVTGSQESELAAQKSQANAVRLSRFESFDGPRDASMTEVAYGSIAAAYRDNLISHGKALELGASIGLQQIPALAAFSDEEE